MRLRHLIRDRAVWIYAILTAAFFHQPLTTRTFFFRDLYKFFYPKKVLLSSALHSGTFPLWDPFTNGGQPYLATPTTAALHPSNVLYAVLPMIVAFNVIPVLHVFFCAVTAYWLGRVVGLSRAAAFVVGIAYAFAGVTLSGANLSAWLLALPWIPLTIGLTHRALRDRRSIVPAAFAAAMPLYAGMAELTGVLFVLLLLWIATTRFDVSRRRRAAIAAIVIAGAIGLALVVLLPATSVIAQSSRGNGKRSYESFTSWSVHPRRLPELIVPQFFGPTNTLGNEYWGRPWESGGFPYVLSIYFGVPLLLLAAFGATGRLDQVDAPRRALAIVAVLAVLLSLGRHLPGFPLIYDYVPLVTIFRFPVKVMVLALLPLALLAGCGVERVTSKRATLAALAMLALLIVVALTAPRSGQLTASFAHAIIATLGFALAVSVRKREHALAALVTLDLLIAGYTVNTYAPRSIFDEPPLAGMVRDAIGPLRFYSAPRKLVVQAPANDIRWLAQWQLAGLDDYSATAFGIPVVFHSDYDGLAPRRITQMSEYVARAPWDRKKMLFDRAGVRAFLTPDDVHLPGVVELARFQTTAGLMHLYENRDAAPARFAGACGPANVVLLKRELNSARYAVDAPCDGRVTFAETHYDGWRATIDGIDAPSFPSGFAFTALNVPKGRHLIERRYFPPRLLAGVVGTLLTALLLALLERRRPAG